MARRHSMPERRNPDRYDRREDGTDPRLLMPMTYVKSAEELNADMLDVHVVDILGHVERSCAARVKSSATSCASAGFRRRSRPGNASTRPRTYSSAWGCG